MRVAKFMILKDICAALSGHAHIWAFTQIALNLMSSLNGAYPNSLQQKSIYAKSV